MLVKLTIFKGPITENCVATQFAYKQIDLFYWKNSYSSKIDFLLSTIDGIIPVEVKSATNTQDKSLKNYIKEFSQSYSIKIS